MMFEELIAAVEAEGKDWPNQHILLRYLGFTRSPEWHLPENTFRQQAEDLLASMPDTQAKANAVCQVIHNWFLDPNRPTMQNW
jgi:hypothetical protein